MVLKWCWNAVGMMRLKLAMMAEGGQVRSRGAEVDMVMVVRFCLESVTMLVPLSSESVSDS
jgi:hypothetical protein